MNRKRRETDIRTIGAGHRNHRETMYRNYWETALGPNKHSAQEESRLYRNIKEPHIGTPGETCIGSKRIKLIGNRKNQAQEPQKNRERKHVEFTNRNLG